ncbi:methylamine utilization protein [Methylophilus sp. YYY-1]|uniref:methylamine utilization protein n=1 Tax=Methylophilus sp. YYY-1 TaxID=2682087 RepID=UPI0023B33A56|nr:methylamine utilization protein [Methylophilus sp. YYY-1]MDF0378946.1 methylamine utilization protein [Methylophilus sp. YYY-1]
MRFLSRPLLGAGLWLLCLGLSAHAAEVTLTVTDAAGRLVTDAVVAFYDKKTPAISPAPGKIVQKNKMFNPKVTVIQTGTKVNFPNEDTVRHHVYSFSPTKKFELKLYSGVPTDPVLFDQAGLVTLGCNIHDSMVGYIYVVDTPFFVKTDDQGKAMIKLSDGQYSYQAWLPGQNKPGTEQKVNIEGAATELKIALP